MFLKNKYLFLVAAILLVFGIVNAGLLARLNLLSIDILHWGYYKTNLSYTSKQASSVVVVAIDENTYHSAEFSKTPKVFWTPQLGKVISGLISSGATVVGLDIVFPTSVSKHLRKYERKFLRVLQKAAVQNKIVLGEVKHSSNPISPHVSQRFAVGQYKNIRLLNVVEDRDGIIRRIPLYFERQINEQVIREPSLALELARRHTGESLDLTGSLGVRFQDRNVSGSQENALAINYFSSGITGIPTYSFSDIYSCIKTSKLEPLHKIFTNKIVLIGTVLDVEDRKLTSRRFIRPFATPKALPECVAKRDAIAVSEISRNTIPGVYIHGHAINNLLNKNELKEIPFVYEMILLLTVLLVVVAATIFLSPLVSFINIIAISLLLIIGSLFLFSSQIVVPFVSLILASIIAYVISILYKVFVSDHDKRYLKEVFSLYLSPNVIDVLTQTERVPELGGEKRHLTILFSDIENFSGLSEGMEPTELVQIMNEYLSAMTEIIEQSGGFVDKYIGDAIVAVFGAPHDDESHALNAIKAAIECRNRLVSMGTIGGKQLRARIGVNTGSVIIGNIGSPKRFNYTVMGDAVNLAQRLEAANKLYRTQILTAKATTIECGPEITFREVGRAKVTGRDSVETLFEVLDYSQNIQPLQVEIIAKFQMGLASFRDREFNVAIDIFRELSKRGDGTAGLMAEYSEAFLQNPPPADWDGSIQLQVK